MLIEIEELKDGLQRACLHLYILIKELYTGNGIIKNEYKNFENNKHYKLIEAKLVIRHAGIVCDYGGRMWFKKLLNELEKEL